jgi:hypothetical protein
LARSHERGAPRPKRKNHGGLIAVDVVLALVVVALLGFAVFRGSDDSGEAGEARPAETTTTTEPPTQMLLVGDSVAAELAAPLEAAYAAPGDDFSFSLLPAVSTDTISVDMATILQEQQPDLVLVMVGSWEAAGIDFTDPTWDTTYVDTVLAPFVQQIEEFGAEVVWLGYPRLEATDEADKHELMNGVYASLAERLGDPSIGYVDVGAAVEAPDGSYTRELDLDGTGALTMVRADDGKHYCPDGAVLSATAVVDALALGKGIEPDPGWETAPWRTDPASFTEPDRCPGAFPPPVDPNASTTSVPATVPA